jgi:hypothetical protein
MYRDLVERSVRRMRIRPCSWPEISDQEIKIDCELDFIPFSLMHISHLILQLRKQPNAKEPDFKRGRLDLPPKGAYASHFSAMLSMLCTPHHAMHPLPGKSSHPQRPSGDEARQDRG